MFIEALADAGVAEGLKRPQAYQLAAQGVLGAAKLVLESGKHPGQLKDEVCSPSGSTIRGLEVLEKGAFRGTVIDALRTTIEKARSVTQTGAVGCLRCRCAAASSDWRNPEQNNSTSRALGAEQRNCF